VLYNIAQRHPSPANSGTEPSFYPKLFQFLARTSAGMERKEFFIIKFNGNGKRD
jgi:hypothetical protein